MNNILNINNPKYLATKIAEEFKRKRLKLNITQVELAKKSGVSVGSLKRFELKAEISLKNLLKLAVILDLSDYFYNITKLEDQESIDEIIKNKKQSRKRASRK